MVKNNRADRRSDESYRAGEGLMWWGGAAAPPGLRPRSRDCLKTCPAIDSSPSPPRSGGEGWGEEGVFIGNSPFLNPLPARSSRGEEKAKLSFETVSATRPYHSFQFPIVTCNGAARRSA